VSDERWLFDYIAQQLDTDPDYPFEGDDSAVFRHKSSGKWFALVMRISRSKLGLEHDAPCSVVNLKCGPIMSAIFREQPGVFRAYHMNKEHWISVLLDGTVPKQELIQMIQLSYDLTNIQGRKRRDKR